MALTAALANQAKVDLLTALSAHTLKLALYTSGTFDKTSTTYSSTGELAAGNGYTTGGVTLSNPSVGLVGDVATLDFDDAVWATATFSAVIGAVLYDATNSNHVIAVFTFTSTSSTNAEFRVAIPSGLVSLS